MNGWLQVTELEAELVVLREVIEQAEAGASAAGGSRDVEWSAAVSEKEKALADIMALEVSALCSEYCPFCQAVGVYYGG